MAHSLDKGTSNPSSNLLFALPCVIKLSGYVKKPETYIFRDDLLYSLKDLLLLTSLLSNPNDIFPMLMSLQAQMV